MSSWEEWLERRVAELEITVTLLDYVVFAAPQTLSLPADPTDEKRKAITQIEKYLSFDQNHGPDEFDESVAIAKHASKALDKIATDPDSHLGVGLIGIRSPWTVIQIWAIKKLGDSGRKEAIAPLRTIVEQNPSEKDSYGFSKAASEALEKLDA